MRTAAADFLGRCGGTGCTHRIPMAAPLQTATLALEKMTCGTCPIVVKEALARVPGVSSGTIDFDKKTATVMFDPETATTARLTQATADAGFPSKLIDKP